MIRMGRSSKADEPTYGQPQQPAAAPDTSYQYQRTPEPAGGRAITESDSMARDIKEGRLSGFVGHGTTLTGETEFQAMLRVDGHLVGTVSSDSGTLIVGSSGVVDANVAVAAAMISGVVNGDIIATEKLQLGRTARITGNIQSPRLIVEEGAILEGRCSMLAARESQENQLAAAQESAYEETPAAEAYAAPNTAAEADETGLFADQDDEDESADAARA